MPKRSAEEKIVRYQEKIRKLEAKKWKSQNRRRIVLQSDTSDSDENLTELPDYAPCADTVPPSEEVAEDTGAVLVDTLQNSEVPRNETAVAADAAAADAAAADAAAADAADNAINLELDPDILIALGSKTREGPEYGEKIHENLAQLWLPLLKKGLPKEEKDKILKDNLIPQNCTLLQAPKLNPEISAAITDSARGRDKKLAQMQQQLGTGITIVNRAIDLLLSKGEDKLKAIKFLSDSCRILCDLHFTQSEQRIKLITPGLEKSFLNVIQDSCRDETLFGNNLSEKIKASNAIQKQSLQIKKAAPNITPSNSITPRPFQARGNWSAPPRYAHKSGRGGAKRMPVPRRQPPPPPAVKPAGRSAPRAQGPQ